MPEQTSPAFWVGSIPVMGQINIGPDGWGDRFTISGHGPAPGICDELYRIY